MAWALSMFGLLAKRHSRRRIVLQPAYTSVLSVADLDAICEVRMLFVAPRQVEAGSQKTRGVLERRHKERDNQHAIPKPRADGL
jgi:hypothetical protein